MILTLDISGMMITVISMLTIYNDYHKIIDARWNYKINILIIRCGACKALFEHRADRFTVRCPTCGKQGELTKMREEWAVTHINQGNV